MFEGLEVAGRRTADLELPGVTCAVADDEEAKLALGRLDAGVGFADRWKDAEVDDHKVVY